MQTPTPEEAPRPQPKLDPNKRFFFSKAYLKEVERGLYGLFRDFMEEDKTTGKQEPLKNVGPTRLLREARTPEEEKAVVLKTVDAKGNELKLIEVKG